MSQEKAVSQKPTLPQTNYVAYRRIEGEPRCTATGGCVLTLRHHCLPYAACRKGLSASEAPSLRLSKDLAARRFSSRALGPDVSMPIPRWNNTINIARKPGHTQEASSRRIGTGERPSTITLVV